MRDELSDYLDFLAPQLGQRESRFGAVYVPTAPPPAVASRTFTPAPTSYQGPTSTARTWAATTPAPSAPLEWRRVVSLAALALATTLATIARTYPLSKIVPMITELRTLGLQVLNPAMPIDTVRAKLSEMLARARSSEFFSAGGAEQARAGIAAVLAVVPASSGSTVMTPTAPTSLPSGGGGITAPSGPSTPTPSGSGGSAPAPGCPPNAGPVPGGCSCLPGFDIDASGTACVPAAASYPPPTLPATGEAESYVGWFLLIAGAAVAYRALR